MSASLIDWSLFWFWFSMVCFSSTICCCRCCCYCCCCWCCCCAVADAAVVVLVVLLSCFDFHILVLNALLTLNTIFLFISSLHAFEYTFAVVATAPAHKARAQSNAPSSDVLKGNNIMSKIS